MKRLFTITVAGFLAAVLAFDLVGFRNTSMLAMIPVVLDMITMVFHEAGRMITGWVFVNVRSYVDMSAMFRLVADVPYISGILFTVVCFAPVIIYHIIMHRLLGHSLSEYIAGPWLWIGAIFLYVIYLVMLFAVPPDMAGDMGGFMTEMLIAYVLLARGVSGRVDHARWGEQFLHFVCGFYILFSMIYMMSLIVRGIPEDIEKLVILEELVGSVSGAMTFYNITVTPVFVAWGLLMLTGMALVAPFMPLGAPIWGFMGDVLARIPVGNPLTIFENLNRKPVRPGSVRAPGATRANALGAGSTRASAVRPIENAHIFEPNKDDFKGL